MNEEQLKERIQQVTGRRPLRVEHFTDTSDPMRLYRGCVVHLSGRGYVIRGHMREPRFGIDDQPKYWVLSANDLETGEHKILKTVFHEEFYVRVALLKIRCYRSPEKEAKVLELTRGDHRFMQGFTVFDAHGNNVRIIDFIRGLSLFRAVPQFEKKHEEYYYEDLPAILRKLYQSFLAIRKLHDYGFCHGDIRNDHIFVESGTGNYRWIDFDLKQDVTDFDLWSLGNILNYAVGKGIVTFENVLHSDEFPETVKNSLEEDDRSAFYVYRIMNLKKVYPYVSDRLSRILLHFTPRPQAFYTDLAQLIEDYAEMLEIDFPVP